MIYNSKHLVLDVARLESFAHVGAANVKVSLLTLLLPARWAAATCPIISSATSVDWEIGKRIAKTAVWCRIFWVLVTPST
eukprot:COSAG05_NODE_10298_length_573_cov_0.978903_1_plen_79_part_10